MVYNNSDDTHPSGTLHLPCAAVLHATNLYFILRTSFISYSILILYFLHFLLVQNIAYH